MKRLLCGSLLFAGAILALAAVSSAVLQDDTRYLPHYVTGAVTSWAAAWFIGRLPSAQELGQRR